MTTISPPNNYFAKCFPCKQKTNDGTHSWILPWIGIAIAIAGIAVMIFAGSYGGALGFFLFGATIVHERFIRGQEEMDELETQIADSDQKLEARQKEIVSVTEKLTALQKSSEIARSKFGAAIDKLKETNGALKQNVADLQQAETVLGQENKTLKTTVGALREQVEQSRANSAAFEQQIKVYLSQHQQFIPQFQELAAVANRLAGTGQSFQGALDGIDETLKRDLEQFSLGIRAWQEVTAAMAANNQALNGRVMQLQASLSQGNATVASLAEENRKLDKGVKERQEILESLGKLQMDLEVREQRMQKTLHQIQEERAALEEARKQAKPTVP